MEAEKLRLEEEAELKKRLAIEKEEREKLEQDEILRKAQE